MKRCTICKEEKAGDKFNKATKRKDGLQPQCRECNRINSRAYYAKNKEKQIKQIYKRKKERMLVVRSKVYKYLQKNPCKCCGESDPVVLEFDHLRDKFSEISNMMRVGYSWERIEAEIKKCQVLCANCHRRKTAKDFSYYKYKMGL